ncbi:mitochondrial carrier homolog 2 isoform X2 [Augochlora pura]
MIFREALSVIFYPIEHAKLLMQIGYEPILPQPSTTLFRQPVLVLPNVFTYVAYIKSVDGFFGCYRGVISKTCASTVSKIAFNKTSKYIRNLIAERDQSNEPCPNKEDEPSENFLLKLLGDIVSRMVATIISQPLIVITARTVAQFVGRETKYNGLFGSILEVYKTDGIAGYYTGFMPRLIGNTAAIILFSTSSYLIHKYLVYDDEAKPYVDGTMGFIATTITYPFSVVSSCMIVNNCGLAAGLPPYMPIYNGWRDCWFHLSVTNQLKRGNSLFRRYYVGQKIMVDGKPRSLH